MVIRDIEFKDIPEIALLHKNIFGKSHFSSTFSFSLRKKYFLELLKYSKYKIAVVDGNQIQGYLIACLNPDIPVKKFMKNNIIHLLITLLLNPKFLIEKIRTILFSIKSKKESIHEKNVSIYLIAVNNSIQNRGIGKLLLDYFENLLLNDKINQYTLAVRSDNIQAIRFYIKNNFTEVYRDFKAVSFLKILK